MATVTSVRRGSCLKILSSFAEFLGRDTSENCILFLILILFGLLASINTVSVYKRDSQTFLLLSDSFSFLCFSSKLLDLPGSLTYVQTFLLMLSEKWDDDSSLAVIVDMVLFIQLSAQFNGYSVFHNSEALFCFGLFYTSGRGLAFTDKNSSCFGLWKSYGLIQMT